MIGSAIRRFVRRTQGLKLQLLLSEANAVRGLEEDSGSGQSGQTLESDEIYREPRDVQAKVGGEPVGYVKSLQTL